MKQNNALQVYYGERPVGILAMTADHKAAFQYEDSGLRLDSQSVRFHFH